MSRRPKSASAPTVRTAGSSARWDTYAARRVLAGVAPLGARLRLGTPNAGRRGESTRRLPKRASAAASPAGALSAGSPAGSSAGSSAGNSAEGRLCYSGAPVLRVGCWWAARARSREPTAETRLPATRPRPPGRWAGGQCLCHRGGDVSSAAASLVSRRLAGRTPSSGIPSRPPYTTLNTFLLRSHSPYPILFPGPGPFSFSGWSYSRVNRRSHDHDDSHAHVERPTH